MLRQPLDHSPADSSYCLRVFFSATARIARCLRLRTHAAELVEIIFFCGLSSAHFDPQDNVKGIHRHSASSVRLGSIRFGLAWLGSVLVVLFRVVLSVGLSCFELGWVGWGWAWLG